MYISKYIVDQNGERRAGCFGNAIRYGIGLPLICFLLWVLLGMVGCKTVGTVSENVNIRDSVVYNYRDSVAIHWIDSIRFVSSQTVKDDSTNLVIQFGQGGGTYNAKTGEATNVAGVQQTDTHHEHKDSTAFYRSQYRDEVAKTDSLSQLVIEYQYQLEEERKRARSGWDRFCTWWFIITAMLLLGYIGYKGYRLYLKFQTGGLL